MFRKNITYVLLILSLYSCQKELSPENDANSTTSVSLTDTTLLRKFIVLDTTFAAPNDTIFKYTFLYDNLQRCISFKVTDGFDSAEFFNSYTGNDTVITKRKIYFYHSGDSIVEYIRYSANNKISTDSILEYTSNNVIFLHNYENTSNTSGTITNKSNGIQFEYNKFYTLRDNNFNLLSVKDSLYVLSGTNYLLTRTSNSNISYDTKINPFYKLVPNFLVNILIESNQVFTFDPFQSLTQKNNILTEIKSTNPQTPGLDNFNNSFQYLYNSNNYPTIVRMRDNLQNKTWKGLYFY